MSLDKFGVKVKKKPGSKKLSGKPAKKEKISEPNQISSEDEEGKKNVSSEMPRKKYYLKCSSKCGYKRTLRKKELRAEDYICEKCGKIMTLYNTE